MNDARSMERLFAAVVSCALLAGLLSRFIGLETHLLWHDEVYTKIFASGHQAADWRPVLFAGEILSVDEVLAYQRYDESRSLLDTISGLAQDEPQHPPLYYMLVRIWVACFGEGTATLRAFSALVSCLLPPVGYWLMRELSLERRAAFVASALLSVSPFFVLYAQEAREYALWSVLLLASCAALCRALRKTEQSGAHPLADWAVFSMLLASALYTSFSTVAVALALVAFVVLRERGRASRAALSAALAMASSALLFSPWAWLLWRHFEAFQASMRWASVTVIPTGALLAALALNVSHPLVDLGGEIDGAGAILAVAMAMLLVTASLASLQRAPRDARLLLGLLLAVPIGMLLLPDLLFGGIRSISTRYLTPSLLALVLIVALRISSLSRLWMGAGMLVFAAALASDHGNARRQSPWTKGISRALPIVASAIHASERPLVVGNMERHHPGNLLALCELLRDDTSLQFLAPGADFELPQPGRFGDVFLFSPIPPFLDELRAREGLQPQLLYEDLHMSLWKVQ